MGKQIFFIVGLRKPFPYGIIRVNPSDVIMVCCDVGVFF